MEKTARVQRRLGMLPVAVGHIPVKLVAQNDVYRGVATVIEELRRVKRQMVIKSQNRTCSIFPKEGIRLSSTRTSRVPRSCWMDSSDGL